MEKPIAAGDCVRIPDGRVARVREVAGGRCKVRVRRRSSNTNQFLIFDEAEVEAVECPKGWMSPDGYNRYLEATLAKMRQRHAAGGHR